MCCSSQSFPRVKLAKILLTTGFVLTNFALFAQRAATDSASPTAVPVGSESLGATIFWVGVALFACVAAAGGVILARKLHHQKELVAVGAVATPEPAKPFSLPNGNGNGSRKLKLNGRPQKSKLQHNNHANGNNSKRRRIFNYHKFYTEMVLQGPSPTSMPENSYNPYNGYGYNGYYVEYETPRINNGNGHVNGNGHANGDANGNTNSHENHSAELSTHSNDSLDARASLIATQKSLIEEQARLIHEQARLIEEKSRLISEKNQLLDRQSQMLDNNLL